MTNETYLLAANIVVWLGVGLYAAVLMQKGRQLEKRIRRMETLQDD
ncbi:CcmD family protein [Desulfovibrio inopinatus]|nr:CcmD family protein [Desulfovibrio inopinatus]